MPRYIGYGFTGTANTTVVTPALNGGVTDSKYNAGVWSISDSSGKEYSLFTRRKQGNWLTTTRGEPYIFDTMFGNVILQTPAAAAYADESIYGHTFTVNTATDNGDGSISLTAATQNAYFNVDWPRTHFYNGDFMVEFELTTPSTIVSGYKYLISSGKDGSNYFAWTFGLYSASGTTGNLYINVTDASGSYDLNSRIVAGHTLSQSTTYNVRFGRIDKWLIFWVDDVVVEIIYLATNGFGSFSTGSQIYFGDPFGANSALATIGRLRITRGFNQHFVNATVTDDNGVSLENHTLCVADNVATSISSAIACRGNINDSTAIQAGMYLRADGSASYSPGTGAFCVRFWFKAPSSTVSSIHVLTNADLTNSTTHDWVVYVSTGGLLGVYDYVSAAVLAVGTTDMHDGAWHYCVAARDGSGNVSVFVDGTREATASNSVDLGNASYDILIGTGLTGGEDLYLISDIELIVGATPIDPTSSSHTVPTDYVTTHANSVLHIKGNWRDDGFNTSGWATAVGSNDACSHFHAGIYVGTGASKTVPLPFDISGGGALLINPLTNTHISTFQSTLQGVGNQVEMAGTAEAAVATSITAFGASAFSIGTDASVNTSGVGYAFWAFHMPDSVSESLDGGTIDWIYNDTSKVALGLFDRASGSATIAVDLTFLGLSGAPCILIKNLDNGVGEWYIWSSLLTSGYYQALTTASAATNAGAPAGFGNNTIFVAPTASTLTLGNAGFVGGNGTVGVDRILIMVFGDSDFVATAVDPAGSTASSFSFADTGFTRTPASATIDIASGGTTYKHLLDRAVGGNSNTGAKRRFATPYIADYVTEAGFFTRDGDYVTGTGLTQTTTYLPFVIK